MKSRYVTCVRLGGRLRILKADCDLSSPPGGAAGTRGYKTIRGPENQSWGFLARNFLTSPKSAWQNPDRPSDQAIFKGIAGLKTSFFDSAAAAVYTSK
jgi:hypothetical protein